VSSRTAWGPLFRPLRGNGEPFDAKGLIDPQAIDRIVRKYAAKIGLLLGAFDARDIHHAALENGASLDSRTCRRWPDIATPSTNKRYDRRGYNLEKAASFFATS
jgi:hypothetical protein